LNEQIANRNVNQQGFALINLRRFKSFLWICLKLLSNFVQIAMSSYFDEHDCEPLSDNPNAHGGNNELLELARFLVLTGNWNNEEFAGLFRDQPPPPTSK
jgi:hypothetical protein